MSEFGGWYLGGVNANEIVDRAVNAFCRRHATRFERHDLEDLEQDIRLAIWRSFERFDSGRNNDLEGWLQRTAAGAVIQFMRNKCDSRYPRLLEQRKAIAFAISLDAPRGVDGECLADELADTAEPLDVFGSANQLSAAGGITAVAWLLSTRNCAFAEDRHALAEAARQLREAEPRRRRARRAA